MSLDALAAAIKIVASNVSDDVRTQVDAVLSGQVDEQLVDRILTAVESVLADQSTEFDPMNPPTGPDPDALRAAVQAAFQEGTAQ